MTATYKEEEADGQNRSENFEKSLSWLEEIVSQLESGENTLEELLKLYEEGSKLA